jgi:hypothetical protein
MTERAIEILTYLVREELGQELWQSVFAHRMPGLKLSAFILPDFLFLARIRVDVPRIFLLH